MISLQGVNVLVVDDEVHLREVLRCLFEMEGAMVYEADGGQAALNLLQVTPVDVVVSDVTMPLGDGFSLLANMATLPGRQPRAILYSGNSHIDLDEAHRLGARAIFAKPFDDDNLIATVRSLASAV